MMKMTEAEAQTHRVDNLEAQRDAAYRLLNDAVHLIEAAGAHQEGALERAVAWAFRIKGAIERT